MHIFIDVKNGKTNFFLPYGNKTQTEIYPYFENTAKQIVESKIIYRKMTPRGFKLI